jgi:hypothetical protein
VYAGGSSATPIDDFRGNEKFESIMQKAKLHQWRLLPMGELVGRIGIEFERTPYLGGTLDINPNNENVVVNLESLDCVTFFENSLDIARCIKLGKYNIADLIIQVANTRYRGGVVTDYSSRLHYTSDWILDNVKKDVVEDITKKLGGIPHKFNYNFMTQHPNLYIALKQPNNAYLLSKIKEVEDSLNKVTMYIIPANRISKIEKKLQDGDIIAIATSKEGIDYSHTGMIFDGKFLHASTKMKKIYLDKKLSEYVKTRKDAIGVTILRPLEP